MHTLARVGWMIVGACLVAGSRIVVTAVLGRPGRLVDCRRRS